MHGFHNHNALVELVNEAKEAIIFDLVDRLLSLNLDILIVVTDSPALLERSWDDKVVVERSAKEFHFGRTLQRVTKKYDLDGFVYFGSGSGVLLDDQQLQDLVIFCQRNENAALFNNFFSVDFAAVANCKLLLNKLDSIANEERNKLSHQRDYFVPISQNPPSRENYLDAYVKMLATDNSLGLFLAEHLDWKPYSLPRNSGTQFDIDTPTDIVLLKKFGMSNSFAAKFLASTWIDHPQLPHIIDLLSQRKARLYVIGRVNPHAWSFLGQRVACNTNILSEGRGMFSYQRAQEDGIRSIIGSYISRDNLQDQFFAELEKVADGALIDTRPIFAYQRPLPQRADRFYSDLFMSEKITDPLVRDFTEQAAKANIPIILGGHSLVAGGLYLLAEIGWKEKIIPQRLHFETEQERFKERRFRDSWSGNYKVEKLGSGEVTRSERIFPTS